MEQQLVKDAKVEGIDQFAICTNPSSGKEEDWNTGPPDCNSSALTTRPRRLLVQSVERTGMFSDALYTCIYKSQAIFDLKQTVPLDHLENGKLEEIIF